MLAKTMFLVISGHRDGPYIAEIDLDRTDLVTVCKDLREGQYASPLAVIELNPSTNFCRDASHDFKPFLD